MVGAAEKDGEHSDLGVQFIDFEIKTKFLSVMWQTPL
jgi:hypothetical protein